MSAASKWPAHGRTSPSLSGVRACATVERLCSARAAAVEGAVERQGQGQGQGQRRRQALGSGVRPEARTRLVAVVVDGLLAQDDEARLLLLDEGLE